MRKSLRITVLVWLLLTCARRQAPVTVTIENDGPMAIRSVEVIPRQGHGILCNRLPVGRSCTARFYTAGETSYEVTVVFEDGTKVTGGGNYAEPGYAFREYVRGRQIVNELEKLPPF
jgi:hypothetical protein